ncbi:hypothetical protein [Bacillus sp. JCM 19041]|uniref:DUF6944 family repetitive protein n=1 Tax=Bacillus sp. JCM 19041 TaxID=1460637 RepID=UPI0006CFB6C4
MGNSTKSFTGAWIQAIGTIVAAVGDTPSETRPEEATDSLGLWGNVLQATGNGLLADTNEPGSLNQAGNAIQATGNSIIVGALVLPIDEDLEQTLTIKGNLFQAAGGAVSFSEDLKEDISIAALYAFYGDLLQVIGNSMQALAGILDFEVDGHEERLNAVGSWIQAIGAVLSALSETKSLDDNDENEASIDEAGSDNQLEEIN